MRWFIPSWHGDLRLEPFGSDTILTIERPTPHERQVLGAMIVVFREEGWVSKHDADRLTKIAGGRRFWGKPTIRLEAPFEIVGPRTAKMFRPGNAVLTAVRFSDGKIVTSSGNVAELEALVREPTDKPETYRESAAEGAPKPKPAPKKEAIATVPRPTPSCPDCIPGSVDPARECLLAFLTEEQHREWARERSITVEGQLTGARYRIGHRHSLFAQANGRICRDLDEQLTVHFHATFLPPEEEVLAAKLILEHREPWLRNEATMLGARTGALVFKNPFGGYTDGVPDAMFTAGFGAGLMGVLEERGRGIL